MNLIQILILLFIAFAIVKIWKKLKQRQLNLQLFVVWLFFWLIVAFFTIWPESLNTIAAKVGVGRGVDTAIYVAILVLFYTVFRIFVRLEKMEKNITELVRKVSIAKADEKLSKKQD